MKQDNARARKKPSRAFIDQIEKLLSGKSMRIGEKGRSAAIESHWEKSAVTQLG
ncbi:hypothetical protein [Raoultibacter massiliensis]|uniref:hypothetical protein n=1 Tax=Raoultibacter massiliensis TaxID=1852371 RepID=UPI0015E09B26|nr:hypothetical protein [Raoultibacter massiliensis]